MLFTPFTCTEDTADQTARAFSSKTRYKYSAMLRDSCGVLCLAATQRLDEQEDERAYFRTKGSSIDKRASTARGGV